MQEINHELNEKQKIIFVTGKGGVGKSIVALSLAQRYAKSTMDSSGKNPRVLLVELGMRSFYSDLLGLKIGYLPQKYQSHCDIALWSGMECLKEYALHLLKIESLYTLFFENRLSRSLIDIAPALTELSILGKITSGVRGVGPQLKYDLIIVDAYATGHMMALLKSPRGLNETIQFGPMAEQTKSMLEVIRNPTLCQYVVVTLPEELPSIEADELCRDICNEVGIMPHLICNKVWSMEELISGSDLSLEKNEGLQTESIDDKSLELKFMNTLEDMIHRQKGWVHYLQHRYPKMQVLPMVFSTDPQKILTSLEKIIL